MLIVSLFTFFYPPTFLTDTRSYSAKDNVVASLLRLADKVGIGGAQLRLSHAVQYVFTHTLRCEPFGELRGAEEHKH